MPVTIDNSMLAPCGMNCSVCYKHVGICKTSKKCYGCYNNDLGKPKHCLKCNIKNCVKEKGFTYCFECDDFPCKMIKNLDNSYNKRYKVSLVKNGTIAKEKGISTFLEHDRKRWTCSKCGGAFSLHDGICSDCENNTL